MNCRVLKQKDFQITQHYGQGHTGVDVVGYGGTLDTIVAHSRGKVIFCQKGQSNNPRSYWRFKLWELCKNQTR